MTGNLVTNYFEKHEYNEDMKLVIVNVLGKEPVYRRVYEEILYDIVAIEREVKRLTKLNATTEDNIGGGIVDVIDKNVNTHLGKRTKLKPIVTQLTKEFGKLDYIRLFHIVYKDIAQHMAKAVVIGYIPFKWKGTTLIMKHSHNGYQLTAKQQGCNMGTLSKLYENSRKGKYNESF